MLKKQTPSRTTIGPLVGRDAAKAGTGALDRRALPAAGGKTKARRLAVASLGLTTLFASFALAAGPASAAGGALLFNLGAPTCLDSDGGQPYPGGGIFQWGCNGGDSYQNWILASDTNSNVTYLQNLGSGTCLDADAGQAYAGGAVIQWACNRSDPYQAWSAIPDGNGRYFLENNGTGLCLDADAQQVFDGGAVIQWPCNSSDPYQDWAVRA